MKPYGQTGLTAEQRLFNFRLSRARRVVGNSFGILVSRFGVLQRPNTLSPQKAQTIVLTCCYLQNYLLRNKAQTYISRGSVDTEEFVRQYCVSSTEHGEQVASQHHCRLLTPEIHTQVQKLPEIITAIFLIIKARFHGNINLHNTTKK